MQPSNDQPRRPWLVAIATVLFDLDVGQRVDNIFPEAAIDAKTLELIQYSSFPDSLSQRSISRSSVTDSSFFFRVLTSKTASDGNDANNTNAPTEAHHHYLYCFAFCRQRQDERLARGGEQRTALLISDYPYTSIFLSLASNLGPALITHFPQIASQIFHDSMTLWPPPQLGRSITIPVSPVPVTGYLCADICLPEDPIRSIEDEYSSASLGGLVRLSTTSLPRQSASVAHDWAVPRCGSNPRSASASTENLPSAARMLGHSRTISNSSLDLTPSRISGHARSMSNADVTSRAPAGAFSDIDLFAPFSSYLPLMWHLWEMMLMAQPVMVYARTPADASNVVGALISLITPLPYSADFRPIFTIHDPQLRDVQEMATHTEAKPVPTVIGVMNPFFLHALEKHPNIIAVPCKASIPGGSRMSQPSETPSAKGGILSSTLSKLPGQKMLKNLMFRPQRNAGLKDPDSEGAWITYAPLGGNPDVEILNRMKAIPASATPAQASRLSASNSSVFRIHLFTLTTAFLKPFHSYFGVTPVWEEADFGTIQSVMMSADPDATKEPGVFDVESFVAYVSRTGIPPPVKALCRNSDKQALALYSRFTRTPNFEPWLCRMLKNAGLESLLLQVTPSEMCPPVAATYSGDAFLIEEFTALELRLQLMTPDDDDTDSQHSSNSRQEEAGANGIKIDKVGASNDLDTPAPESCTSPVMTSSHKNPFVIANASHQQAEGASGNTGNPDNSLRGRMSAKEATVLTVIRDQLKDVLAQMPEDLQMALLSTPSRRELLTQHGVL